MMKRFLIPLLLILLFSMPAHALFGGLSAKDYPRPGVTFYSSTPISSFQSINKPGTMTTISAQKTTNGNVQKIKIAPVGDYTKGVSFLFQTCYTQKVATVTYTDKKIGTKTFLVLSCPSNHKIRLAPTTGTTYKVRHRDVQYDYPLNTQTNGAGLSPNSEGGTPSGSDTDAKPPSEDQAILEHLNFYLNEDNNGVVDIQEKNAYSSEVSPLFRNKADKSDKIKSFDVVTIDYEIKKYKIDPVDVDSKTKRITIVNTETHVKAYAIGIPNSKKPFGTYRYDFKDSGGVYSLEPRKGENQENTKQLFQAKTLKLVDSNGVNAVAVSSSSPSNTRYLCDKYFDLDSLFLQIDDDKNNKKRVRSISTLQGSGTNEYYTLTFRNDDGNSGDLPDIRYLDVYCQGAVDKNSKTPATDKSKSKDNNCGTISTITQTPKEGCKAGEKCSFTFTVKEGKKELPNYCLIGFIDQSGILLEKNTNKPLRWIFECDKLKKKKIDLTLPDSLSNPRVYLFPFHKNVVEKYFNEDKKGKEKKKDFDAAIKNGKGYRTEDALFESDNTGQCGKGEGGAMQSVNIKTEKSAPDSDKGSAGKVNVGNLGKKIKTVKLDDFKDKSVITIENNDVKTGFVLVKLNKQNLNNVIASTTNFFKQSGWLFNNFPVIKYERWYYVRQVDGYLDYSERMNTIKKYNSYDDVYCLRRNIGADNTPYAESLGTCGAYLFFPKKTERKTTNTGSIDVYTKQVTTRHQNTVLSLVVTGASRIMTQHLDYPEDEEMLKYGFWTTTKPKYDKDGYSDVTVSLGYRKDKSKSHPVYACAAGNIQKLSADFRENENSEISDTLQPTRAFIESNKEFAYCSAAGATNKLFQGMKQAYADIYHASFISDTTLKTTIREDEFQGTIGKYPFEIIGKESSGTTTQSFTAETVQHSWFNDETLKSTLLLAEHKLEEKQTFKRTYKTKYDDEQVAGFTTSYTNNGDNKGWGLKLGTKPNKYIPSSFIIEDSQRKTGDLQISFGGISVPWIGFVYGPVHSTKIISHPPKDKPPKNEDSPETTDKNSADDATMIPSANVIASNSLTGDVPASQKFPGATVKFESTKPDFWPGKIFATYSREKDKDPADVLSQKRIYASLLYKGSMDNLTKDYLIETIQLAANEPVSLSLDKLPTELGDVTYGLSEDDDLNEAYKDTKWKVVAVAYDYMKISDVPQNLIVFVLEKVESASQDTTSSSQTKKAGEGCHYVGNLCVPIQGGSCATTCSEEEAPSGRICSCNDIV